MSLDLTAMLSSFTPSTGGMSVASSDASSGASDTSTGNASASPFGDLVEQLNSQQAIPAATVTLPAVSAVAATDTAAATPDMAPATSGSIIMPSGALPTNTLTAPIQVPAQTLADHVVPQIVSQIVFPAASDVDTAALATPRPVQTQMIDIQIAATAPQALPVKDQPASETVSTPSLDTTVPPVDLLPVKANSQDLAAQVQATQAQAASMPSTTTMATKPVLAAPATVSVAEVVMASSDQAASTQTADTQASTLSPAPVLTMATEPGAPVPAARSVKADEKMTLPAREVVSQASSAETLPAVAILPETVATLVSVAAPVIASPAEPVTTSSGQVTDSAVSPVPVIATISSPVVSTAAVQATPDTVTPVAQTVAGQKTVAAVAQQGPDTAIQTSQIQAPQDQVSQISASQAETQPQIQGRPEVATHAIAKAAKVTAKSTGDAADKSDVVTSAPETSDAQLAVDAGLVPVVTAPVLSPVQPSAPTPSSDLLAAAGAQPVGPTPDLSGQPSDLSGIAPQVPETPELASDVSAPKASTQDVAQNQSPQTLSSTAQGSVNQGSVSPAMAAQSPSAQAQQTPDVNQSQIAQVQTVQVQAAQTQTVQTQAVVTETAAASPVAVAVAAPSARPFRLINAPQSRAASYTAAAQTDTTSTQADSAGTPAAGVSSAVTVAPVRRSAAPAAVSLSPTDPSGGQSQDTSLNASPVTLAAEKPAAASVAVDAVSQSASALKSTTSEADAPVASPASVTLSDAASLTAPVTVATVDTDAAPVASGTPASQMSQAAADNMSALGLQISKRVSEGTSHFAMELHPADMGRVDVQLRIDRTGELTAHLSFDDAITSTAFRARESELREQLSQAGLNLNANALSFSSRSESSVAATPVASDPRSALDSGTQQGGSQSQNQNQAQSQLAQDQQRPNAQAVARALAQANRTLDNADLDTSLADLSYRPGAQTLALNLIV